MAFQMYKGTMYPLPLGLNEALLTVIQSGEQFLPLDENESPDKLTEMNDLGQHQFVIAITEDQSKLPTPTQSPQEIGDVVVHHLSVLISI